jgi:hypothetical protein
MSNTFQADFSLFQKATMGKALFLDKPTVRNSRNEQTDIVVAVMIYIISLILLLCRHFEERQLR